MEAYDKGDAKTFGPFLQRTSITSIRTASRPKAATAIEKLLAENFQANPGVHVNLNIDEIKQLTPEVRVNRGVATS